MEINEKYLGVIELKDGSRIELRLIREDDAELLASIFEITSPLSLYNRFHTSKTKFSTSEIAYLTQVESKDHFALVALGEVHHEKRIVADARFIRLEEEPDMAEFAILIADEYQKVGLGKELMSKLILAAKERDIHFLSGTMLSINHEMFHLVESLGLPLTWELDGITATCTISI